MIYPACVNCPDARSRRHTIQEHGYCPHGYLENRCPSGCTARCRCGRRLLRENDQDVCVYCRHPSDTCTCTDLTID